MDITIYFTKSAIQPHECSGADCIICKATASIRRAAGEPTKAQTKAGNYRKKTVKWRGLTIKIENPAGSIRRGDTWETRMLFDYGYIARTEAVDGDEVDVYLGPDIETAPSVFIVHQRKYGDWKAYDEDKCMIGFMSEESAREAYLKQYDDPRFLGAITEMPVDEFISKVRKTKDKPAMIKSVIFFKAAREAAEKAKKEQSDQDLKDGVIRHSSFYGPMQSIPSVGDIINVRGNKYKIMELSAKKLTKKELDFEEDAGQPGLDYGTSRVTMKLKVVGDL